MPALTGVFHLFPDLDTITAAEIINFSGHQVDHHSLENHLANRILYPQTVAMTKQELDLDFMILALAVQKHPNTFFDGNQSRLVIPESVVYFFPPLTRLISVLLLGISQKKVIQIWLKSSQGQEVVGSCLPQALIEGFTMPGELTIKVDNQSKVLIPNQLNLIPTAKKQTNIQLGQQNLTVLGGMLGLFIDLRKDKV